MAHIVSITSQGQITIPAKLRRELGLTKKGKAIVSKREGVMVVKPIRDLLDLKGSLKTNKKPLSNKQLHEVIANAVAEEYARTLKG